MEVICILRDEELELADPLELDEDTFAAAEDAGSALSPENLMDETLAILGAAQPRLAF